MTKVGLNYQEIHFRLQTFKSYDLVFPCYGLVIVHSSSTNKWVEKWLMAESLTFNFAKVSP